MIALGQPTVRRWPIYASYLLVASTPSCISEPTRSVPGVAMRPAFFTRLVVGDVQEDVIVGEYIQWALGTGRFARHRSSRLKMGVPPSLTAEALKTSGDHPGDNDCSLFVRRAEGIGLLRLIQRDSDNGSIFWHNIVRVTANGVATQIEHAILRSAP